MKNENEYQYALITKAIFVCGFVHKCSVAAMGSGQKYCWILQLGITQRFVVLE